MNVEALDKLLWYTLGATAAFILWVLFLEWKYRREARKEDKND